MKDVVTIIESKIFYDIKQIAENFDLTVQEFFNKIRFSNYFYPFVKIKQAIRQNKMNSNPLYEHLNALELQIATDESISYMLQLEPPVRGIECDIGWSNLILGALYNISAIDPLKAVRIELIKEKFGTMRMHLSYVVDCDDDYFKRIDHIRDITEKQSSKICEQCGSTENVEITKSGWKRTLCEECRGEK